MSSMDERMQDRLFMIAAGAVVAIVFVLGLLIGVMW